MSEKYYSDGIKEEFAFDTTKDVFNLPGIANFKTDYGTFFYANSLSLADKVETGSMIMFVEDDEILVKEVLKVSCACEHKNRCNCCHLDFTDGTSCGERWWNDTAVIYHCKANDA